MANEISFQGSVYLAMDAITQLAGTNDQIGDSCPLRQFTCNTGRFVKTSSPFRPPRAERRSRWAG